MITVRSIPPFLEITCEPDETYGYVQCESSIAGLFFIRYKHGESEANIWVLGDEKKGTWSEKTYNLYDLVPKETCKAFPVKETVRRILPTKNDWEAANNN